MPSNANYAKEIQKLGLGAEVILFEVDLTPIGGSDVLRFVPMADQGTLDGTVSFGDEIYTPFPITAEGFKWSGQSSAPRPTVSIANLNHAMTSYVLQYGSLLGAQLRRLRTFETFLDSGATPDGGATMPPDIYRFEKKTAHNDILISWEMASWIDHQGVMLPKRIVSRDYCDLIYRRYVSGTTFDYAHATCPYVGTAYFDKNNVPTTADKDVCSHTLKGCKLRFPNQDLPFGGFPGCPKFRVS